MSGDIVYTLPPQMYSWYFPGRVYFFLDALWPNYSLDETHMRMRSATPFVYLDFEHVRSSKTTAKKNCC